MPARIRTCARARCAVVLAPSRSASPIGAAPWCRSCSVFTTCTPTSMPPPPASRSTYPPTSACCRACCACRRTRAASCSWRTGCAPFPASRRSRTCSSATEFADARARAAVDRRGGRAERATTSRSSPERLMTAVAWINAQDRLARLPIGLFGANAEAAIALVAAANDDATSVPVVACGGPPRSRRQALHRIHGHVLLLAGADDHPSLEHCQDAVSRAAVREHAARRAARPQLARGGARPGRRRGRRVHARVVRREPAGLASIALRRGVSTGTARSFERGRPPSRR